MQVQINKGLKPQPPLEEVLVENSTYSRAAIKRRLLKLGLLRNECYMCHMPPMWQGQKLSLQIDHINGVKNDHRLENLRMLCPNCHSQTASFSGRNVKRHRPLCTDCNKQIFKKSTRCRACNVKLARPEKLKINWPTENELRMLLESNSYLAVGRMLGVSDNAIRKRLKLLGNSSSGRAAGSDPAS